MLYSTARGSAVILLVYMLYSTGRGSSVIYAEKYTAWESSVIYAEQFTYAIHLYRGSAVTYVVKYS